MERSRGGTSPQRWPLLAAFPAVHSLISYSYPLRYFRSKKFSYVPCSGTEKGNELKMQFFEGRKRWEKDKDAAFGNKNEIKLLFFFSPTVKRFQRCKWTISADPASLYYYLWGNGDHSCPLSCGFTCSLGRTPALSGKTRVLNSPRRCQIRIQGAYQHPLAQGWADAHPPPQHKAVSSYSTTTSPVVL